MTVKVPSRGYHISAYFPALGEGVKIPVDCLSAGFTTGVTNGGITSAKIGAAAVTSAKIGLKAVVATKMNAAFLSGTIVSGHVTVAVAHGLAAKPKSVVVAPLLTLAQASSATVMTVCVAAASAATSTNIYLIGTQKSSTAIKYAVYVQI